MTQPPAQSHVRLGVKILAHSGAQYGGGGGLEKNALNYTIIWNYLHFLYIKIVVKLFSQKNYD